MFGRQKKKEDTARSSAKNDTSMMEEGRASSNKQGKRKSSNMKKSGQKKKHLDEIPARRVLHKVFLCISILTILCALWMLIGQILGIIAYENTIVSYVLRGYVIILCILVFFIEIEWPQQIRDTPIFHYWITRGLFYAFIGVIGMQENESSEIVVKKGDTDTYQMIADIAVAVAWNMIGCGILYFVMGVFCLHIILNRLRTDYQERLQAARDRQNEEESDETDGFEGQEVVLQQQQAVDDAHSAFADDDKTSHLNWTKVDNDDKHSQKNENTDADVTREMREESDDDDDDDTPSWAKDEDKKPAMKDDEKSINDEKSVNDEKPMNTTGNDWADDNSSKKSDDNEKNVNQAESIDSMEESVELSLREGDNNKSSNIVTEIVEDAKSNNILKLSKSDSTLSEKDKDEVSHSSTASDKKDVSK